MSSTTDIIRLIKEKNKNKETPPLYSFRSNTAPSSLTPLFTQTKHHSMANESSDKAISEEATKSPPKMSNEEGKESASPFPKEGQSGDTTTADKEESASLGETSESKSLAAMMEKEEPTSALEESSEVTAKSEAGNEEVFVVDTGKMKEAEEKSNLQSLISFKDETNQVNDLSEFERKAFEEFKQLVHKGLESGEFSVQPRREVEKKKEEQVSKAEASVSESDVSTEINPSAATESNVEKNTQKGSQEEVSIWGIPLLKDDRSDVVLLKFLRARDFKPKDAFVMIKNTIQWRREFKIDELIDEDLGDDLEKVVFMHGHDRLDHPVCYNVYGEFQNKELYHKTFSDEEKRLKFLRWRIQFLERSIRKLDFSPSGVSTIYQVTDLKNSPGPGKRELRLATKQALQLLQDNYPEFVAKQVFINVPWWYLAFYMMISPFMTQRTKNKFVFASPARTAETLFKHISPEQVPVQFGGLSVDYCDCNPEFTVADPATEITMKPTTKQIVEIIIYEKCVIVWELRVVGWEVTYSAEFVPDAKDAYTIIIQKPTKMISTSEPVVSNRFKVGELGKILLTVDNPTSKKKKLLYRFKIGPFSN